MTALSGNHSNWQDWRPARLIPTSGIKGVDEQETRATSALLSVMMAVPEFARALLKKADAPAGNVQTFLEIPIKSALGSGHRPDGAIVVTWGTKKWTALVEVKTGLRDLDPKQIEAYLDLAKEQGFQAVISISNHMTSHLDPYPVTIDKRKTRATALRHWSWVEILSEAIIQKEFRGVSDKDQAWILGELIAYLEHPQSGAMEFQDMGQEWVAVRDGARERTLRAADPAVSKVVTRWDQFVQYLCLHLGRELGFSVKQVLTRKEDPVVRRQHLIENLVAAGQLDGTLRIPRAAGDVSIIADLRGRIVTMSMDVAAPTDRGSAARLSWLIRQLENAPPQVRVDAIYRGGRSEGDTLATIRENPRSIATDRAKEIKAFVVSLSSEMGMKRGGIKGSFIGEASELLRRFYREVVQRIKPWAPPPAKLPVERSEMDVSAQTENIVEAIAREKSDEQPSPADDLATEAVSSQST